MIIYFKFKQTLEISKKLFKIMFFKDFFKYIKIKLNFNNMLNYLIHISNDYDYDLH